VGELGLGLELLFCGPEPLVDLLGAVGAAADQPRAEGLAGGAMNTATASGIAARTWRAP
jgi:hypothetical protein